MAAPAAVAAPVSAQVVGNAFVQQYYHILHQSPGLVHKFYQDISKLGRLEEDGTMSVTTTMDAINAKILSLNYNDFTAEIKTVDAQESLNNGVNVLVTGYMTGKDNVMRNFAQSFFLAPQDKGYFVLNDMFRYIESTKKDLESDHAPSEDVVAPETPAQVEELEVVPVAEDNTSEQGAVVTEESEPEMIVSVENGEVPVVDEEEPVPEVVDEVQDSSLLVVESNTKIEEVPKKSYASIVMDLKQNGVAFSSPAPRKLQPKPKIQEQHLNNNALTATVAAEPPSNVDTVENGVHEEEGEGYSVYIKGLPVSATPAIMEEEFKKFGPIKTNGIQVRSNRGFCFGFVEFETPEAVQKAIEASPVSIDGKNAVVEEKRSTSSKGSRGRYVAGRGGGGFRNDGMRGGGRGSYNGGRGYNRGGDYGGRNDYGYRGNGGRGGANANRGGGGGGSDGYHRDNNGGTARNMAQ